MTVSIVSTTKTAEILTNNGVYGPLLTLTGTGSITVAGTALANQNGSPTIINDGLIQGTGANGVGFNVSNQQGFLTNTGRVTGGSVGVEFGNGGTVTNAGTISGAAGNGVEIFNRAGLLTNSGIITGSVDGAYLQNAGTVLNTGSISGTLGIFLQDGGTITNTGGTITGTAGLGIRAVGAAATISNSGTVTGTTGGMQMENNGTIANTGLISGTNFGISIATGGTIIDAGTISGGTYAIKTTNQATLVVNPGAVFSGTVKNTTNQGHVILGGTTPGTLNIGSSFTGFNNLTFAAGSTWTLQGSVAALASGQTITGFAAGDAIVLNGFTPTSESFVTGTGLVLNNGITSQTIAMAGSFTSSSFNFTTINGVVAVTAAPCFAAGTMILTDEGAVPVEALKPGDTVVTMREGGPLTRQIIWTGKRSLDLRRHPQPALVRPVRIIAGAFGPGLPERDLRLSPDHAIYARGALFTAISLVNGSTIFQEEACTHVCYHHIELDSHDILLAEGLPCESFLDTGNRTMFDAVSGVTVLHPDFAAQSDGFCVKLVRAGEVLETLRAELSARAAAYQTNAA